MIKSALLKLLTTTNDLILQLISLSRREKVTSPLNGSVKDNTSYQVKKLKESLQSMNEDNLFIKSKLSKTESELEFSKSQNTQLVNIAQRRLESIEDLQTKLLHMESRYQLLTAREDKMKKLIAENVANELEIRSLKLTICKLKADITSATRENDKNLINLRQQHAEEVMRIKSRITS